VLIVMSEDAEIHAVNRCSLSAMWTLRARSAGFAAKCASLTDRFSQLMTSAFDGTVFSTLPIGFRPGIRPGGFVGLWSFHRRH
jgi:hypothetical protein